MYKRQVCTHPDGHNHSGNIHVHIVINSLRIYEVPLLPLSLIHIFANNVILTRTERLMMGNRPKNPANARNKNVLVVGGSGSGKTRFWLKPNLLQCHSSYVVTDPKGDIVIDCGQALSLIHILF